MLPSGEETLGANLINIEALLSTVQHIAHRGYGQRSVVLITWSFQKFTATHADLEDTIRETNLLPFPLSPLSLD
jgi:hypothetical protein